MHNLDIEYVCNVKFVSTILRGLSYKFRQNNHEIEIALIFHERPILTLFTADFDFVNRYDQSFERNYFSVLESVVKSVRDKRPQRLISALVLELKALEKAQNLFLF